MSGAPALVLIDLQRAIDHPAWGTRNHPQAEARARRMLSLWRHLGWPFFHIRHDSREPDSKYRPGQPMHEWKPETAPLPGETILGKTTCNAFASTDLADRLRAVQAPRVFVCGVITNNSVESTVRAGGDLGFPMYLIEDACFTFGKGRWSAQDVHEISIMNLEGEYATITTSTRVVTGFLASMYEGPGAAHALRVAEAAQKANAGETAVLAALLYYLEGTLARSLGFSESVSTLVEQRGKTLRFLAAGESTRKGLTPEEWRLVEHLGGPLSAVEADSFSSKSISFTLLRLRHCEEQARRPGPPPPGFSAYRASVEGHLSGAPSQHG